MPAARFGSLLTAEDIQFGYWDRDANKFEIDPTSKDGVYVDISRLASKNNSVGTYFLRFAGFNSWDVRRGAVFETYIPTCFREGFVADGIVDVQSGNWYTNGFCIHSNAHVELSSNNYFAANTVVSMPDKMSVVLPTSGFATNEGLQGALHDSAYQIRILNRLQEIMEDLYSGGIDYAPDYIISIGYSLPEELTLIALGPLTNIALAIQKEPRLKQWVKEIIVMGGAVEVRGNVTPYAEFNIYNDPHAANVVFDSGVPVTLVGLDVCTQVAFHRDDTDWRDSDSTGGRLAADVLSTWFNETHPDLDQYALCDPLAVAAAIQPDLLETRTATVSVEEDDAETYGQTRATYGEGNVKVALGVDVNSARGFILERLIRGA
ncbi:MAG: nucleoside hydrolase [Chloroflexi bacterium]|nr:nucleoside hydrolase [Chloroflexota bacterium]